MMSIRFIKDLSKLNRRLSTFSIKSNVPPPENVMSSLSPNEHILPFQRNHLIALRSQITSVDIKSPWQNNALINPKIDNPIITPIIETPVQPNQQEIVDRIRGIVQDLEMPAIDNGVGEDGKQANKLIKIRRRKMRRHKLKKLRKKMKFEWAKVRQRRELRKEKAFQAVLVAQIKEAEKFSAEEYVAEKLRKANEIVIPKYWKGKRLPEFIIREKMGLK
ncbi:uncharacterized protein LOC119068587 [Bradysia coprophila]|uniref:uncharacterized protein LOC119068587 n=1 Tax=Bradysia coprophila TaxID=38358 RepID=UPI00187DAFA0|nr:uncharacterized protein LOC119068587 [Bradysia coprophila]